MKSHVIPWVRQSMADQRLQLRNAMENHWVDVDLAMMTEALPAPMPVSVFTGNFELDDLVMNYRMILTVDRMPKMKTNASSKLLGLRERAIILHTSFSFSNDLEISDAGKKGQALLVFSRLLMRQPSDVSQRMIHIQGFSPFISRAAGSGVAVVHHCWDLGDDPEQGLRWYWEEPARWAAEQFGVMATMTVGFHTPTPRTVIRGGFRGLKR